MDHPTASPVNAPRGPGVLAELAHQALLAGLCQHFALPFAGELAADRGVCEHGRLLSVPGRAGKLRPWLPGCLAAGMITTRAGPQETHRIGYPAEVL
jgi:hypothetical protein